MNRAEWCEIASAIHERRVRVAATWSPGSTEFDNAEAANARKLIYFAKLEAIDRIAIDLAHTLKRRSSRFDVKRFLEACGASDRIPRP